MQISNSLLSGAMNKLHVRPHLQNHVSTCDYRDVQCTLCGLYVQQFTLDAHQNEQCPMRPITCQHCKKDVPVQQLQVCVCVCVWCVCVCHKMQYILFVCTLLCSYSYISLLYRLMLTSSALKCCTVVLIAVILNYK